MKKKSIILIISGILVVGSITGFSYAKDINNKDLKEVNIEVVKESKKANDMIEIIKDSRYEDVEKFMKNRDYEAMDEFMNNLTDQDYENMIKIMKKNGYSSMARMMEGIDKDQMIQMHNSMGGARGCHSSSTQY